MPRQRLIAADLAAASPGFTLFAPLTGTGLPGDRPELVRVRVRGAAGLPRRRGPSRVTCAAAVGRLAALETKTLI
jgi:hypothetical protein